MLRMDIMINLDLQKHLSCEKTINKIIFHGLTCEMKHRLCCLLLLIVLAPIGIIATLSVILYSILFPMVKDNWFTKFGTWYANLLEEIGL